MRRVLLSALVWLCAVPAALAQSIEATHCDHPSAPTSTLSLSLNLDAASPIQPGSIGLPDPHGDATYASDSLIVFDSLDRQRAVRIFFRKVGVDAWTYRVLVPPRIFQDPWTETSGDGVLHFDVLGRLAALDPPNPEFTLPGETESISLDFGPVTEVGVGWPTTQYGSVSQTHRFMQDGFPKSRDNCASILRYELSDALEEALAILDRVRVFARFAADTDFRLFHSSLAAAVASERWALLDVANGKHEVLKQSVFELLFSSSSTSAVFGIQLEEPSWIPVWGSDSTPEVIFFGDSTESAVRTLRRFPQRSYLSLATLDGRRVFLGDGDRDGQPDPGKEDVFRVLADVRSASEAHDDAALQSAIERLDRARDQIQYELARANQLYWPTVCGVGPELALVLPLLWLLRIRRRR